MGVCQRATGGQTERAPVAKIQNKVVWDYNPKCKIIWVHTDISDWINK